LKYTGYDKTVLLGHFHFHFSRVDFLLCEDDTALQNTAAQQTHETRLHLLRMFKLQYCTKFDQLILRIMIKIFATRCHIFRLNAPDSISAGAPPHTPLGELTELPQTP